MAMDPAAKQAAILTNQASVAIGTGKYPEGIALLQQAIALKADLPEAHVNLGIGLYWSGRLTEAAHHLETAIQLRPDFLTAHLNLAAIYREQSRYADSIKSYQRCIALKPDYVVAHEGLANVFSEQGRYVEAVEMQQRVIALEPGRAKSYAALAYSMILGRTAPPTEVRRAAEQYGALLAHPEALPMPPRTDRLRIGIMSAEVSFHSVSFFLETFLRAYDRARYEVFLYVTRLVDDPRAAELQALADHARVLVGISDEDAVAQIRADVVHILVDTTGLSRGSRLPLIARRCAPVQCHYIGNASTTGVPAMDYFIGDAEVTPPAYADHFSERIYRLPRCWYGYTPPRSAPSPEARAVDAPLVIGSFNHLSKVAPQTISGWAQVLKAIPDARLLLKDRLTTDPYTRDRILGGFTAEGIDTARIELAPRTADWVAHMRGYGALDVALDPFPLTSSGTTGFDAIYMGVPVVAMRGDWSGGRMAASMLKGLGRPEWVAETPEDYVRIVKDLVGDRARLRSLRHTLRDEMLASSLCNGPSLATALQDAFEDMYASAQDNARS